MDFTLDSRLADSAAFVEDWTLCRVMLKNDKTLPWLYLVPRKTGVREFFDLSSDDLSILAREIARAGRALDILFKPDKVNTAALGNMVPQMHVHVFGRYVSDFAWPKPVWTVQQDEIPYTESEQNDRLARLKDCFARLRTEEEST